MPILARAGVRRFLLREKTLAVAERRRGAALLRPLCRELGIAFWISEDLETAAAVRADGVHLSERSPSPLELIARGDVPPLGLSLHADSRRTPAEIACCEHVFLSPVFRTQKPGPPPLGTAGFQDRAQALAVPVFALGGITADRLPELLAAGVRRIAGIRLFFEPGFELRSLAPDADPLS